ncbi:MAG: hypothetical protein EBV03_12510, partial [Proteobacteria bacterium]|nr:hypothetical protein [Pseudomonadota bacterium]
YIEKEQPHQSWFNIIKRRLIASVAIIGAGHAIEYSIGKKELTDTIVSGVKKGMKSVGAGKIADNPTFGRYLGFAALDTIFTGMHAFTMSLTTGAKKAHMPKEVHEHAPEGVESRGEIVTAGKPASNFADRTPRREKRDAEQYKKPQNVPAPAESHTALASKDDGSLSLAL